MAMIQRAGINPLSYLMMVIQMKNKVYEIITNRIIEGLQTKKTWLKGWISQMPKNAITKKTYSGINLLLLSLNDYSSPYFLTYKQARQLKGYVKQGEKATIIIYWKIKETEKNLENGEIKKEAVPILRYYKVFNLKQCEGIEIKENKEEFNPVEKCEDIISNYKDKPEIKQGQPCYINSLDLIRIPNKNDFLSKEEYYSALFHELTHSTGNEKRLNREGVAKAVNFGSDKYSKEELIAELGNAFLCATGGIANKVIDNQQAYINNWIDVFRKDKKILIQASRQAQRSTDYIIGSD